MWQASGPHPRSVVLLLFFAVVVVWYSSLLHHPKLQNANICVFENVSTSSLSFMFCLC